MAESIRGVALNDKIKSLEKVKTDPDTWEIYYLDKVLNEKWVKEYPDSELHGGGSPVLRKLLKFPWE